jgi:Flp pilus assembly protein TadG
VRSLRELRSDKRGAVLAEHVIAIVPILMTFFTFVQLSKVATARLVVKHSAIVGARAAAVISNANNNTPDAQANDDGKADIRTAVQQAMGPWYAKGGITNVNVDVNDQSNRDDYYGWVTVKVTADYNCRVPMGRLACGAAGVKKLEETYRMPHQGAIYKM